MSFGWLTMARRSSWIAFRKFVLEEKRDLGSRISEIDKELDKIGTLFVKYERTEDTKKAVQKRKRFYVTKDSSLEKLVMVYIATGGNPLDISMFISPKTIDAIKFEGAEYYEYTAMGGVVAPLSGSPDEMVYTGGWLNWNKDPKWNIGNADIPMGKQLWTIHTVNKSREWVEKEIRAKRNKVEEKIIKLCDLYEQLEQEKALLELRNKDFSPLNKIGKWASQQTIEYPIHLIDKIFWKQTDGINGDPDQPRTLKNTDINLTREEMTSNEDIQMRTEYYQFYEDPDGEEYPITSL